ncbi:MAG: rhodanese-like domain-containing protein [Kofleriaceae bacterium]
MKVALALALAFALVACKDSRAPAPTEAPKEEAAATPELTVEELAKLLSDDSCQAVDANGPGTRKRLGTIPGAVLLTDFEAFALSELPADKARGLVFYCANEHCGASHAAAERARLAGYTDVKVLPAGIAGWAKAGKPTIKL